MITVVLYQWETATTIAENIERRCQEIIYHGHTYVKRSALPRLLVDLPSNLTVNGKKTYVFEVKPDSDHYILA